MRLLSILTLCLICLSGMAQSKSKYLKIAGEWKGVINVEGDPVEVVFHIKYDGSAVSGTMDIPDQNAFGLKIDEITFVDGDLKMVSKIVEGTYEGVVNYNKVEGKWKQFGKTFDLLLKKKLRKRSS